MKKKLLVTLLTATMMVMSACGTTDTSNNVSVEESIDIASIAAETERSEEEITEMLSSISTETGYAMKTDENGATVLVDTKGNKVGAVEVAESGEVVIVNAEGKVMAAEEVTGYTVSTNETGNFVLVDSTGTEHKLDDYDELVKEVVKNFVESTETAKQEEITEVSTEKVSSNKETKDDDDTEYEAKKNTSNSGSGDSSSKRPGKEKEQDNAITTPTEPAGPDYADESGDSYSGSHKGEYDSVEDVPDDVIVGGNQGDTVVIEGVEYTYDEQGSLVDNNPDPDNFTEAELESARAQDEQTGEEMLEDMYDEQEDIWGPED